MAAMPAAMNRVGTCVRKSAWARAGTRPVGGKAGTQAPGFPQRSLLVSIHPAGSAACQK